MKKLFIVKDGVFYEILSVEKKSLNKYSKSIVFITENGEFFFKDEIKFAYECEECGKLSKPITGYKSLKNRENYLCSSCVKKGDRNPFYGKTHDIDTIKRMKRKNREKSLKLWKNKNYRKKVIEGVSKPRKEEFKQEQSDRVKKWYEDNPKQKIIRSRYMKRYWNDGIIVPNTYSINRSKGEIELYNYLKDNLNVVVEENKTIHIDNKWYIPDIIIDDKVIVEYFGDYWHGNPKKYKSNDIVAHKIKAKYIWEKDEERIKIMKENGYKVFIVWQSDNFEDSLKEIKKLLIELSQD